MTWTHRYEPDLAMLRLVFEVSDADPVEPFDCRDTFTREEWRQLARHVLVPECLEDKWIAFAEGDQFRIHRSWTGRIAYRLTVEETAGRMVVCRAEIGIPFRNESEKIWGWGRDLHENSIRWITRDFAPDRMGWV